MRLVSTRGRAPAVSFREALFKGLAPDGGLYVPARLEPLPAPLLSGLHGGSLVEVATAVAAHLIGDEIPRDALARLLSDALNFPIPLVQVADRLWALELFRGPTFAFKDVGARVMARLMAHFDAEHPDRGRGAGELTVLVATSGDTGSAVAQAFFGLEGTRVVVLFPHGRVSAVQEAQFTTLGGNVTALAVDGTFDQCQRLAKEAFANAALRRDARLTSANSINIGRLLPQTFYYVHAALQLPAPSPVVSVPSGNFGNLTAGLIARTLGIRVERFIAATTINDTLPRYLHSGRYDPRASVPTLANAMDVGDPSNVERMRWLFDDDLDAMRALIVPSVHTDDDVRHAIGDLWRRYGYLCDPHSAIAYLGTLRTLRTPGTPGTLGTSGTSGTSGTPGTFPTVFLATAHPAKFREVVEPIVGREVPLPPALEDAMRKPRHVERIQPRLSELRDKVIM